MSYPEFTHDRLKGDFAMLYERLLGIRMYLTDGASPPLDMHPRVRELLFTEDGKRAAHTWLEYHRQSFVLLSQYIAGDSIDAPDGLRSNIDAVNACRQMYAALIVALEGRE